MEQRVNLLVIGGYGMFGERFCRVAAGIPGVSLMIAGRNKAKAGRLAAKLRAVSEGGEITGVAFDLNGDLDAQLAALAPDVVINMAGPFQRADYELPRAAIGQSAHYLDIADGRDYVNGIKVLDEKARDAGVFALSGASTVPAISMAALDRMTNGWGRVFSIDSDLVINSRAAMGASVVKAALSYAGKPVRIFNGGGWEERPGWGMLRRLPAGLLGRHFTSLCDVPDLEIAPVRFGVDSHALFRAGSGSVFTHLGLWLLSLPVRWGWIGTLAEYTKPIAWLQRLFRPLGPARGGLVIKAVGTDGEGAPVQAEWAIAAPPETGPNIPILPPLALIRKFLDGGLAYRGAGACVGVLDIKEIEAELERFSIPISVTRRKLPGEPLYARCLGKKFERMPVAVRDGHQVRGGLVLEGRGNVTGGTGFLHRLFRKAMGFPEPVDDVAVTVVMAQEGGAERWTRRFGDHGFSSVLSCPQAGFLEERFGPASIRMRIDADETGLEMVPVGWRFGPLPLPLFLAPVVRAVEHQDADGRFRFDVALEVPLLGQLAGYAGWLAPKPPRPRDPG